MKEKMPAGKFAGAVRIGEEGQVVLPREVLELFGLKPGERMMVLADQKKGIVLWRESQ